MRLYKTTKHHKTILLSFRTAPPKASICGERRPYAVLGYPLSLHCEATGDHPITVEWLRANASNPRQHLPIEIDPHIFNSDGELTFSEIRRDDIGAYICRATNKKILSKFQQVSTLTATLRLQGWSCSGCAATSESTILVVLVKNNSSWR